jgi:hypothetical protein
MTNKEVMELSLAAFECVDNWDKAEILERAAINALRAALAQPEPEPVAWMNQKANMFAQHERRAKYLGCITPLYTAPLKREWVGLTDKEIESLADSLEIWNEIDDQWRLNPHTFACAIEAKLKERNNG